MTFDQVMELKNRSEADQETLRDIVNKFANDCVEGDGGADETTWWDEDKDGIILCGHWEVTWRYGGHDSGTTRVPLAYILDPVAYKAKYDKDKESAKAKKMKEDKAAIRRKDLAQLAKLKEKYPDEETT